jgi:hypothetical protein
LNIGGCCRLGRGDCKLGRMNWRAMLEGRHRVVTVVGTLLGWAVLVWWAFFDGPPWLAAPFLLIVLVVTVPSVTSKVRRI